METTDFMAVYNDCQVKDFIHRAARRYSKRDSIFWQDLVEEGWIGISKASPQRTAPHYCKCAFRAIKAAYMRDWRFEQKEAEALKRLLQRIESEHDA